MALCNTQKGFSTIEVLVATAILVLGLTGVIIVSFGNQSVTSDSQTGQEALNKAQALLEDQQAKDFPDIASVAEVADGIYKKRVDVVTPWNGDADIKQISAVVTWTSDHNRVQTTQLSALATDYK